MFFAYPTLMTLIDCCCYTWVSRKHSLNWWGVNFKYKRSKYDCNIFIFQLHIWLQSLLFSVHSSLPGILSVKQSSIYLIYIGVLPALGDLLWKITTLDFLGCAIYQLSINFLIERKCTKKETIENKNNYKKK